MIDAQQAIIIVKEFYEQELPKQAWFEAVQEHIEAVILYGSVAKGMNRADSDIDVLLFMPPQVEEAYTEGEYFYAYKDQQINIVIRSIERLRRIAHARPVDAFQKEVFRNSVIIHANNDEVPRLLDLIKRN